MKIFLGRTKLLYIIGTWTRISGLCTKLYCEMSSQGFDLFDNFEFKICLDSKY